MLNTELPHDPAIPLLGVGLREVKHTSICKISHTWLCIIALFITAKKWKQHRDPSLLNSKTKCGVSYNGMLFSRKMNEMLIPATMRMNSENTVLSDKNQTQKGIYCMISFVWNAQNRQIYRDRKEISVC